MQLWLCHSLPWWESLGALVRQSQGSLMYLPIFQAVFLCFNQFFFECPLPSSLSGNPTYPSKFLLDFSLGEELSQSPCRPNQMLWWLCPGMLCLLHWIITDFIHYLPLDWHPNAWHSLAVNLLGGGCFSLQSWGAKINKLEYRPIFEFPDGFFFCWHYPSLF